jgi:hypothetical protein
LESLREARCIEPPQGQGDHKPKATPTYDPTLNVISGLVEKIAKLQVTTNELQGMIVQMERNQHQNRQLPRNGYKGPPSNQRPPTSLEPTNMIGNGHPYFCRACQSFHDENTCAFYLEVYQSDGQNRKCTFDTCNNLFDGQDYQNWQPMEDEEERAVKIFGKMPSLER